MRLLIKIGSALISRGGGINLEWLKDKVAEISSLHHQGHEILIVTSGAVAAGMEIEGLRQRPKDTLKLQLLSGEGQIRLMKCYRDFFSDAGILVAQVLLTHHNFDTRKEEETIRTIMEAYLGQRTIPIVNENDLVAKEELEYKRLFTDNDILSALVAVRLRVDLLVILTDVDGLYREDPKRNSKVELLEEVGKIDQRIKRMASRETNSLGLGGMYSKVMAAEMAAGSGIPTIVANGNFPLADILENRVKRTFFKSAAIRA